MDTKLFFPIILFDLVWIAEVKFANLAFATTLAIHLSWHMNKNLRQGMPVIGFAIYSALQSIQLCNLFSFAIYSATRMMTVVFFPASILNINYITRSYRKWRAVYYGKMTGKWHFVLLGMH